VDDLGGRVSVRGPVHLVLHRREELLREVGVGLVVDARRVDVEHRDNAWDFVRKTSSRGRGDPGDEIYQRLADDGAELLDYVKRQDVDVWSKRQTFLNDHGAFLKVDGIAGPNTMAAMHAQGFKRGQDMPN
jgi:hypothetical protein